MPTVVEVVKSVTFGKKPNKGVTTEMTSVTIWV